MRYALVRRVQHPIAIGATGLATIISAVALILGLCLHIKNPLLGWFLVATVISILAFGACIALLFIGRPPAAAGRHTCKRCGYDIRLITSDRCPECGRRIPMFSRGDEAVLAALRGRNFKNPEAVYIAPEDTLPERSAPVDAADTSDRLKRRWKAFRDLSGRRDDDHP